MLYLCRGNKAVLKNLSNMKTTNDYKQQAIDFLKTTGTTFKAELLRHGKHFENDKQTRDIYTITLTRGFRIYKFNFGQSVNCSGEAQLVEHLRNKIIAQPLIKKYGSNYAFNLKDRNSIIFSTSLREKDLPKNPNFSIPSEYDILACLTKYDPGTFEDFCSEFGYNTDSISAEKTYKAVCDEWLNVSRLFNDSEIELLQEIQ